MLKNLGIGIVVVAGIAVLYVAMFGLTFLNIQVSGFLKAETAKVERKVFEETPSFTRGMASEFSSLLLEWETTKSPAVCAVIKQRFSTYYNVLPANQQAQYDTLSCI